MNGKRQLEKDIKRIELKKVGRWKRQEWNERRVEKMNGKR